MVVRGGVSWVVTAALLGGVLVLGTAQPAAGGGKRGKSSRRCRKGKDCTACAQIVGCGWCAGPAAGGGSGRCMDKTTSPVGFWDPEAGKVSEECDGTLAEACLEMDPTHDTDRMSQKIERTVPYSQFSDASPENGKRLAEALDLRGHMQGIVDTVPGASFVSTDPPIIRFENFLSDEECEAVKDAGEPHLEPSTGTGALKDGRFERTKIQGRTSYNAWCMGACKNNPTMKIIDARIANVTGFSYQNMEYYQILRYNEAQEYQGHSDWIDLQAGQPSGPRLFTFFLYMNDVAEGGGGATWFPQATVNDSTTGEPVESSLYHNYQPLNNYYSQWNNAEMRQQLQPPSEKFSDVGFRARPQKGSAIMWPNVDLDNIYRQNPKTFHAAEELEPGHTKWAANAWIHMRDFRTPHAMGLTG